MVDMMVALPILLTVGIGVGVAFKARSLMLGGIGGIALFGYIAIQSGETLFIAYYVLIMFFIIMGVAVFLTKTQMGDTA